jgi:hypothetical protein
MSSKSLMVTGHENRGDAEVAFGFVYFNDDSRVAYSTPQGVVADATGGWAAVTDTHVRLAEEYLRANEVPLDEKEI